MAFFKFVVVTMNSDVINALAFPEASALWRIRIVVIPYECLKALQDIFGQHFGNGVEILDGEYQARNGCLVIHIAVWSTPTFNGETFGLKVSRMATLSVLNRMAKEVGKRSTEDFVPRDKKKRKYRVVSATEYLEKESVVNCAATPFWWRKEKHALVALTPTQRTLRWQKLQRNFFRVVNCHWMDNPTDQMLTAHPLSLVDRLLGDANASRPSEEIKVQEGATKDLLSLACGDINFCQASEFTCDPSEHVTLSEFAAGNNGENVEIKKCDQAEHSQGLHDSGTPVGVASDGHPAGDRGIRGWEGPDSIDFPDPVCDN